MNYFILNWVFLCVIMVKKRVLFIFWLISPLVNVVFGDL